MDETKSLREKVLEEAYVNGIQNKTGLLHERLNLKKATVDYTLQKLLDENYFSRTKYEIDLNKLGIGNFAWVLVSVNWEKIAEEDLLKKLLSLTQVVTIAEITGKSDLALKIFGSSITNISAFILMVEKSFEGIITEVHVYFANAEYKRHYLPTPKKELYKINKVDCAIMHEKMANPKISLIEISQKHKFHRNTVSKRWDNLWKEGIVVKELPDLTQKGYDELKMGLKAFTVIKPVPGREEKIIKMLIKRKWIQDIFTTLSNEIVIIFRTENSAALATEQRLIGKTDFSIKRTNTSIFLTKHNKNSLSLPEIKGLIKNC
ncbi:MAG: Lrp/AsnC family transcriptional regulator [archaeon]|jgi:DNA-binding Lrp family transcriptional regulator